MFLFFCILNLITIHLLSSLPLLPCSLLLSMLSALNVRSLEFINYGASLLIGFPRRPYTPPTTCRRACACSIFLFSTFDLSASPTQPFSFLSVQGLVFNSYLLATLKRPYTLPSDAFVHLICASADSNIIYPIIIIPPALHLTLHHAFTTFSRFPSDGINQAFLPGDLRTIICFASLTHSVRLPKQETGEWAARRPFTLRHNGSMGDQITLRSSK